MLVRKLEEKDIAPLVKIGSIMHKEGSFKKINYSKEKVFATIKHSLTSDKMAFFVAKDDDGYAGMMGGFILEYPISFDKYATDFLLFIKKEKRGGDTAIKLLNLFEDWAKGKNVKEIRLGSSNGVDIEKVRGFYEWQKYETIGHIFRKEI